MYFVIIRLFDVFLTGTNLNWEIAGGGMRLCYVDVFATKQMHVITLRGQI